MDIKNWTGERLETFVNSEVAIEHLHRYAIVLPLVKGKKVLDIASGEGYGSNLIAGQAKEVVGVDISAETVERAAKKYNRKNLSFRKGSAAEIPLKSGDFDVVVSFETIEHHDQHDEMLAEIKRVLKPDGLLIISSPDKLYYTDRRKFNNQFHVKELYENEFKALINKNFQNSNFYNQRATFVSLLIPDKGDHPFKEFKGDYSKVTESSEFGQLYNLAIASDAALPDIYLSAFSDDELMYRLTDGAEHKVKDTASYKIGHSLLWPLKMAKKIFSKS